jgi:hypothetical protein
MYRSKLKPLEAASNEAPEDLQVQGIDFIRILIYNIMYNIRRRVPYERRPECRFGSLSL